MKKLGTLIFSIFFLLSANTFASEKLSIEKQLVGIVGAISGTVKTETRDLKPGDKIYLNETIFAGVGSGTQILLLDQSTFTVRLSGFFLLIKPDITFKLPCLTFATIFPSFVAGS